MFLNHNQAIKSRAVILAAQSSALALASLAPAAVGTISGIIFRA
jgi:hypothetical protein